MHKLSLSDCLSNQLRSVTRKYTWDLFCRRLSTFDHCAILIKKTIASRARTGMQLPIWLKCIGSYINYVCMAFLTTNTMNVVDLALLEVWADVPHCTPDFKSPKPRNNLCFFNDGLMKTQRYLIWLLFLYKYVVALLFSFHTSAWAFYALQHAFKAMQLQRKIKYACPSS